MREFKLEYYDFGGRPAVLIDDTAAIAILRPERGWELLSGRRSAFLRLQCEQLSDEEVDEAFGLLPALPDLSEVLKAYERQRAREHAVSDDVARIGRERGILVAYYDWRGDPAILFNELGQGPVLPAESAGIAVQKPGMTWMELRIGDTSSIVYNATQLLESEFRARFPNLPAVPDLEAILLEKARRLGDT